MSRFDETLLAPSMIRLFGRPYIGLTIDYKELKPLASLADGKTRSPFANLLTDKLQVETAPKLARIYGFSYEGHYYKLARPTVFLVHGPGEDVLPAQDAGLDLSTLGVEFKDETFVKGVRMWGYDKSDMTLRVDIASGALDELLLESELPGATSVTGNDLAGRAEVTGRAELISRAEAISRGRPGSR